jgi:hypothetical protein
MIHLPASVRVYLCLAPCDMRKSFDGRKRLKITGPSNFGDGAKLDQA